LRGGGGFFHQRRILLRHIIDRDDGLIDLLDAGALLAAGGADLLHDIGHLLHRLHDVLHGRPA
jgi:metal-dependent HD superfamily phosphatase/phosphodiesterase